MDPTTTALEVYLRHRCLLSANLTIGKNCPDACPSDRQSKSTSMFFEEKLNHQQCDHVTWVEYHIVWRCRLQVHVAWGQHRMPMQSLSQTFDLPMWHQHEQRPVDLRQQRKKWCWCWCWWRKWKTICVEYCRKKSTTTSFEFLIVWFSVLCFLRISTSLVCAPHCF